MAITSEKLLNRPSELHRRYGGRLAMQEAQQQKMIGGGPSNVVLTKKSVKDIASIKVNVIKIESILKGTLAAEKKSLDVKKRQESGKRREKQEEKLETKPQAEKGPIKMPKVPRMGFLDWVKNFIGNVILGYFAVRMLDYLPKLIPIVKFLGSATDFVIDFGGKLLDGLITFVDWGYKAIDATTGFIKKIGGSGAADNFGKFLGLIDNALFLTTTIAGAMAVEALTSDSGGPGDIVGDQVTKRIAQKGAQQVATSAAGQAGGAAQAGGLGAGAVAGIVAGAGLLASALGEGAFQLRKIATKPIQDKQKEFDKLSWFDPRKYFVGAQLGGMKMLLGPLAAIGVMLDIVGAPFRYAIELLRYPFLSEEDKKKQAYNLAKFDARIREDFRKGLNMLTLGFAFKEKGSFGNIYGNKGAQKEMMGKMAGGGITRGGKAQTGTRRTIGGDKKKGKYKKALARKPSKTQFKGDPKDPLVKSGQELDKTKYFGPVLAVSAKLEAKEEPTQKDYDNVGLGLNLLIAKGLEEGQLKGGLVAAFAEGGMVDDEFLEAAEKGVDVSSWISKTFRDEFETNAQRTLRLIRERKEKKGPDKSDPTLTGPDGEVPSGALTEGQWGPLLDLISGKESGGNYEAMYPSTTLKGATKMTIADVARRATGAVGKYQQLPQYLVGRAKAAGLNPDKDLYSPENQEKIIINVNIKGRGGEKWLKGEISDEQFMQGLSQEFASLPNAQGKFYYPGQRSSMTAEKVKAALSKVKKGGYSQQEIASSKTGITGPLGTGKASSVDQFNTIAKKYGLTLTSDYRPGDSGYHGKNRARDYSNDAVGRGTPEQLAFAKYLVQNYGSSLTQLIYTPLGFGIANGKRVGLDYWGASTNAIHYHHVHVALAKGGRIKKPTYAIIGEKGPEFVFDADTTAGLDRLAPGILEKLNVAKTKPQLASILQSYAAYEQPYADTQVVEVPVEVPVPTGGNSYGSSGSTMTFVGGGDDPFDTLYQGG